MSPSDLQRILHGVVDALTRIPSATNRKPVVLDHSSNPSTDIDVEISNALRELLGRVFVADFISEEHHRSDPNPPGEWQWIVDPLDGTLNVLAGANEFATGIGLRESASDACRLAAVSIPSQTQVFTAIASTGSYLNGVRFRTSTGKHRAVAIGFNEYADQTPALLGTMVGGLLENGWILRQSGSAIFEICRVALGIWQGFVELGVKIWDIAAADLIAREAGCVSVRRPSSVPSRDPGQSLDYVVAASNELLRDLLLQIPGSEHQWTPSA